MSNAAALLVLFFGFVLGWTAHDLVLQLAYRAGIVKYIGLDKGQRITNEHR